jgi:hypothetical protein
MKLQDVAKIMDDVIHGTPGSLVTYNADGIENEIISIAGNYKDSDNILNFQNFKVIMDSNSCNAAVGRPVGLDITEAYEAAISGGNEAEEYDDKDGSQASDEDEESGIFKRFLLRKPLNSRAAVAISQEREAILARHREILVKLRHGKNKGRDLQDEEDPQVEIQTGSSSDGSSEGFDSGNASTRSCCTVVDISFFWLSQLLVFPLLSNLNNLSLIGENLWDGP